MLATGRAVVTESHDPFDGIAPSISGGAGQSSESVAAAWRMAAPAAAAALAAAAADRAGSPIGTAVFLTLAAVLIPVARLASTRLMLGAIGGLAMSATIHASGVNLDARWLTPLVATTMAFCAWLAARHRPGSAWWPRVDLGDGLVFLGGLALMCLLAIPYWGLGPEGVLLDLGRGFDNLMHLEMFLDVIGGAESTVTSGYPKGFHTLLWLMNGGSIQGLSRSTVVPYFGAASAVMTAASAVICGWTAVGVAGSLRSRGESPRTSRAVGGLAFALFACLGGLYAGMFEVGHVAFLLPTGVVIGSSWIALRAHQFSWSSTAILGCASLGVLGSYPPLVAGLVPAGIWLSRAAIGDLTWARLRWLILGFVVLIVASSVLALSRWGVSFRGIGAHSGEVSTPMASIFIYSVLGLLLALVAVRSGLSLPVSVWGPTLGLGSLGAAIATAAALGGEPVLEAYYAEKILQATWLAGSVLMIGLSAALVVRWRAVSGLPKWLDMTRRAGALILVLGAILAVPDGRYWNVKGAAPSVVEQLQRRIAEADHADNELHLLAIAAEIQDAPDEVVILADPYGWLLPFVVDDKTRFLSTATWAVNLLRGPLTSQTADVSRCIEGPDGASLVWECSRELVRRDPDTMVTIVVEEPALAESLEAAGVESHPSIRVVLLADLLHQGQSA